MRKAGAILSVAVLAGWAARGFERVEVLPLTDRILMVHVDEGHVEHHRIGEPRSAEKVVIEELDVAVAADPARYRISSADDPAYAAPQAPLRAARKSKGTDFAWFVDKWINNAAVNERPDHTKEHWLYLYLPAPMKRGATYAVDAREAGLGDEGLSVTFSEAESRSEAVHVNILGYVPDAPRKYGYVYHWLGDGGSLSLGDYAGNRFRLVRVATGETAFSGTVQFRSAADAPETGQVGDAPPHGNYLNAEVYECDFSAFGEPGRYVLTVDGVGCSFPFEIAADVYREAFRTVCRGLYHNRSGIELKEPYTSFTRPAPHNPGITPGFAGKLVYTALREQDFGSEGGDSKAILAQVKGPLDAWGWYQDAGDWDSYVSHLRVARELLTVYEIAPRNFRDGELNIPESGNGLPDILDEAAWLPRFCRRLRQELLAKEYGTGGIGLRIAGDAFGSDEKRLADGRSVGQGSWQDVDRTWAASGEDPWATYWYAGAAAQLAHCLKLAGSEDPEGVDWGKEAAESFAWAWDNTRPEDEEKGIGVPRAYAAATLFRLTGDAVYEERFVEDVDDINPDTLLRHDLFWGPAVYVLSGGPAKADTQVTARLRSALLRTADAVCIETPEKRALRWGGDWWMPMLIGQQTTPWVLEGAVAYTLTRESDPAKAEQYRAALYTTCDYFLGTNSLNMTWVTGLGVRHPQQVFHMDAWYNGRETAHPGIIPYGPWRKDKPLGQGPWDNAWPNKTVHPPIDEWPGNERWFDNRCTPLSGEFTIHQNTAPAAAIFGFLCSP